MRKSFILVLIFFFGTYSSLSQAQDSSASLPQDLDTGTVNTFTTKDNVFKNKKFEEYQGITDPFLTAIGGSLSRYSVKADLVYGGPDIANLSDEDRPNPDHNNQPKETNISGRVGVRYRLSSQSTLGFGTGVKDIYPAQGSYATDRVEGVERYQVSTPYVGYDFSTRVNDFQIHQDVILTRTTFPSLVRTGQEGGASYAIDIVRTLGVSRYALAISSSLGYNTYDRPYQPANGLTPPPGPSGGRHGAFYGDGRAVDERISFTPDLRYTVSNRVTANTGFMIAWDHLRYRPGLTQLYPETVSENLGFSYSFSRDVLVFPFLGFYPARLAANMTTINVTSIFSVF